MAGYNPVSNILDFAVAFNPSTAFPLDARSMFGSLTAAQEAAATAENAGSSNTKYYIGQQITVYENDVVTHYSIEPDKTLKPLGSNVVGDNKTIVLEDGTLSLKDFGTKYYKYNAPDTKDDGTYENEGEVSSPVKGTYYQIGGSWFKYSGSSFEAAEEGYPHDDAYYTPTMGWVAGLEPKVHSTSDGNYELAWYEPSQTTVEGLQSAISTLQSESATLKGRVNVIEPKVSANEQAIATETSRATAKEAEIEAVANQNKSALEVLNGSGEGSVTKTVADEIAKIIANAPESFDTLKEISDWISSHESDAAGMNSAIQQNATDIDSLEALIGTLPEEAVSSDLVNYIAELVEAEKTRAMAAEQQNATDIDTLEATVGGLGTAAQKNIEDFATAAQGAKADTAVQSVEAGNTNGSIKVDGTPVTVYTAPVASTSQAGDVKVDGTSISATAEGVISVRAVDHSKVTGLANQIATAKQEATEDANQYTDENAVLTTSVVAAGSQAASVDEASDTKVASEKLLMSMFEWKETM